MSAAENPEKLFANISKFVADSHELLQRGAIMELAGLDDHVRSLCDQVLSMSQEDRLRYGDKLQTLLGALKDLGDTLVAQRDTVAGEIRDISNHRKASVAYKVVDASDSYGGKKDG